MVLQLVPETNTVMRNSYLILDEYVCLQRVKYWGGGAVRACSFTNYVILHVR